MAFEAHWVQGLVLGSEPVFDNLGYLGHGHDSLIRCLGLVILPGDLAAMAFFAGEDLDRLEVVRVATEVVIDLIDQFRL